MYEKIGNFFFNLKICHEFDDILLHSYDILKVDFLNYKSYTIGFGRTVASLPTMKLQSHVSFLQETIFAP